MPVCWDHAAAIRRLDGDEDLLQELIVIFFEEYPKQMARLRQDLAHQDFAAVREIAHSLKGSLLYLRAAEVAARALELESAAGQENYIQTSQLVDKLTLEIEVLRELMTSAGEEKA